MAGEQEYQDLAEQMRREIREPVFVVRAGFWLLCTILGLIGVLLVGVLGFVVFGTPSIESFGNPPSAESLARWKDVSETVFGRATGFADLAILKILLPVATLLLGYVFGTRADQ